MSPYGCFHGCSFPIDAFTLPVSVFDITFSKPVSFVSGLQMGLNDGNGAYVATFDGSLQEIGLCSAVFFEYQSSSAPPGCFVVTSLTSDLSGLGNLTVSLSKPDITTVLVAGADGAPAFGTAVQFSVTPVATPESGTLALLALALASLMVTRKRCA
jgi:hypothetical protein